MYKEIINKKFNRLTTLNKVKAHNKSSSFWLCRCDCGKIVEVSLSHLKNGHTKSCGCYRNEKIALVNYKHGYSNKSKTYKTWKLMRQRCNNKNATNAKWYHDKGIKVCPRWDSYVNFLSDMGEKPVGKTIDRINSDKDYSVDNCRWATPTEQAENNLGCFIGGGLRRKDFGGLRTFEKIKGVTK